MSLPQHEAEFIQSLQGEDELGVVVRTHIHVEAKLIEMLSLLADSKALDRMDLEFFQKVHLAVALGLREEHAQGLLALGKIRNDFAHKLGSSLTDNRVKNLYEALSAKDKAAVQELYRRTESQIKQHHGKRFQSLLPRDRFVLIAVAIHSLLIVAIHELRGRGE
jgi:hypothetical protein